MTCTFSGDPTVPVDAWDESWDEWAYGATVPSRTRRRRGYIEQLPSGSWRSAVYAGADPLTGEDLRLRETCRTGAEAEKALTKLQRQVDENKHPKSAITVAAAVEQWMEVARLEGDHPGSLRRPGPALYPADPGRHAGESAGR